MDLAPTFPPPQGNIPAIVADSTELPEASEPGLQPSSYPLLVSQSAQSAGTSVQPLSSFLGSGGGALDNAFKPSNRVFSVSLGAFSSRFVSSHLTRSFSFVGQAFRTAQIEGALYSTRFRSPQHDQSRYRQLQYRQPQYRQPQYSATIPVQWARSNDWKSRAATADIQVSQVNADPYTADIENNAWAPLIANQCLPKADRELQIGPRYRLSLSGQTLGYVADADHAYLLAQQLRRLMHHASFEADEIAPYPADRFFIGSSLEQLGRSEQSDLVVGTDSQRLFTINSSMAEAVGYSKEWAAIAWANNLRLALEATSLGTGEAQMSLQNMQASDISMEGTASWYGPYFHGRVTANGETYNQNDLTVAHKSLPFGTQLKVRNLLNNKTVVVRVNDRGPYIGDRSLDLSKAAAVCLGSDKTGVVPYEAVVLEEK
ncbi:MAG: septal ring lytic transglycosylase RlpA family protein [Phormidesmis sp.]